MMEQLVTQTQQTPAQACLACPDCQGPCLEVLTLATLPEAVLSKPRAPR